MEDDAQDSYEIGKFDKATAKALLEILEELQGISARQSDANRSLESIVQLLDRRK